MASLRLFSVIGLLFLSSLSSSSSAQKVTLALYYETLCPYCSRFIVNGLSKIFENGLINIVDLKLIPYGNAKIDGNGNIICQHGEYECLLNTVEACAIQAWPDLNKHFTYIYCVERLVAEGKYKEWASCFAKMGLDPKPIEDCYKSGHGKQLELEYAKDTNNLQPPHRYVPWVVVDNKPLLDDYENFITYVCKAYKGDHLPKACKKLSLSILPRTTANLFDQVCYTDNQISQASSIIGTTKLRSE